MKKVSIENNHIRLEVLPDLGGKIVSIFHKASGHECLFQKQIYQSDIKPIVNNSFEPYAYGFDECFPSIKECNYIDTTGKNVHCPDHGFLWREKAEVTIESNTLTLMYKPDKCDILLSKKIHLIDNKVVIHYNLYNHSEKPITYLWSSHPLLNVTEEDKITFPEQMKFKPYWLSKKLEKNSFEINKTYKLKRNSTASKSFSKWNGSPVHVHMKPISMSITGKNVDYLGLWLCEGGWPSEKERMLTIAIEPTNAPTDSLLDLNNNAYQLKGLSKKHWEIHFELKTN